MISVYNLATSGSTCERVKTSLECEMAAIQLRLSDTSVTDDGQRGVSDDPPYCYYEGESLKFNSNGQNQGSCSSYDKCLCIAPGFSNNTGTDSNK